MGWRMGGGLPRSVTLQVSLCPSLCLCVCVSSLSIGNVDCRLASGDIDYPIPLLLATLSLLSGETTRLLAEVRFLGGYMVEVM
jgi:hypothetical protein